MALVPVLLDGRDELYADFQQYYSLNLDDLMDAGEFGAIAVLAVQLPLSSRTLKRLHPELAWDEQTYILALIADQLANIAYGLGGGKGRKPKPIPRPKASKKKETKNRLDVSKTRVDELLFAPRRPSATTVEMEGKGEQG